MLSKSSLEIPYYSEGPLSDETKWIAFPILISTRKKKYEESLQLGNSVLNDILNGARELESAGAKISEIPGGDKYKKLGTIVEFKKLSDECITEIYSFVFLKYEGLGSLWDKLKVASRHLDYLNNAVASYKSNKSIELELGIRFIREKR